MEGSKTSSIEKFVASFVKDFLAGGLASIGAKTFFAPVDRVKLLLQTQAINTDLSQRYTSALDCVRRVYREQGILSFWRGNLANVYRYFPNQAMNFSFKDRYKGLIFDNVLVHTSFFSQNNKIWIGNLLAGGLAGATSLFISFPFEVARTRLATDVGNENKVHSSSSTAVIRRRFRGTWDCFYKTYHSEGIRGLYSGLGISLFGVVIFKAMYMGGYDSAKHFLSLDDKHVMMRYLAAQFITTTVGTACYPIDTIKRRLMIQQQHSGSSEKTRRYKGAVDCVRQTLREEGVRGLFAGLSVNILRGVSGALLLVGYDEVKKVFNYDGR